MKERNKRRKGAVGNYENRRLHTNISMNLSSFYFNCQGNNLNSPGVQMDLIPSSQHYLLIHVSMQNTVQDVKENTRKFNASLIPFNVLKSVNVLVEITHT